MNETTERFVNTPDGDDGGLQCLNIPPNPENRYFNCRETNQGRLQNSTFYVIDFQEVAKTKFGEKKKYVVKIKDRLKTLNPQHRNSSPEARTSSTSLTSCAKWTNFRDASRFAEAV